MKKGYVIAIGAVVGVAAAGLGGYVMAKVIEKDRKKSEVKTESKKSESKKEKVKTETKVETKAEVKEDELKTESEVETEEEVEEEEVENLADKIAENMSNNFSEETVNHIENIIDKDVEINETINNTIEEIIETIEGDIKHEQNKEIFVNQEIEEFINKGKFNKGKDDSDKNEEEKVEETIVEEVKEEAIAIVEEVKEAIVEETIVEEVKEEIVVEEIVVEEVKEEAVVEEIVENNNEIAVELEDHILKIKEAGNNLEIVEDDKKNLMFKVEKNWLNPRKKKVEKLLKELESLRAELGKDKIDEFKELFYEVNELELKLRFIDKGIIVVKTEIMKDENGNEEFKIDSIEVNSKEQLDEFKEKINNDLIDCGNRKKQLK